VKHKSGNAIIQRAIHHRPQQSETQNLRHVASLAKDFSKFRDDMLVDEPVIDTGAILENVGDSTTGAQGLTDLGVNIRLLYRLVPVGGVASIWFPPSADVDVLLDATAGLLRKRCRVLAKTVDATLGRILRSFLELWHLQQCPKVAAES
jgi:hypothetical protein